MKGISRLLTVTSTSHKTITTIYQFLNDDWKTG